jgi:hypothetical protein
MKQTIVMVLMKKCVCCNLAAANEECHRMTGYWFCAQHASFRYITMTKTMMVTMMMIVTTETTQ